MSAFIAISGLLIGTLAGWYARKRSNTSPPAATAHPHQIDHVCEIDQRVSTTLASLHAYEKRLLLGNHLSQQDGASTKPTRTGSTMNGTGPSVRSAPRDPLDGKTLLDIKRETDQHIRECTSALTRATAVLQEDMLRRAQEVVDALVALRETLEAQEADEETDVDTMSSRVAALHRARTRFLNTVRPRLGLSALSEKTEEQIEELTEQAFSPAQCPRPFMAAGVRLPQERF